MLCASSCLECIALLAEPCLDHEGPELLGVRRTSFQLLLIAAHLFLPIIPIISTHERSVLGIWAAAWLFLEFWQPRSCANKREWLVEPQAKFLRVKSAHWDAIGNEELADRLEMVKGGLEEGAFEDEGPEGVLDNDMESEANGQLDDERTNRRKDVPSLVVMLVAVGVLFGPLRVRAVCPYERRAHRCEPYEPAFLDPEREVDELLQPCHRQEVVRIVVGNVEGDPAQAFLDSCSLDAPNATPTFQDVNVPVAWCSIFQKPVSYTHLTLPPNREV